jgi:hypothetical protein
VGEFWTDWQYPFGVGFARGDLQQRDYLSIGLAEGAQRQVCQL